MLNDWYLPVIENNNIQRYILLILIIFKFGILIFTNNLIVVLCLLFTQY